MRPGAVTLAALALLAAGCGGGGQQARRGTASPPQTTHEPKTKSPRASHRDYPAWRALRLPPVPRSPLPGYLLIADRNNGRVLLVSPSKRVVWQRSGLGDPDDAFFTPGWHTIITNEEFNETLTEVSLRTHRTVWTYGHAGVPGSSPGYLDTPDDAYRLPNGQTTVADIRNCRVVVLSRARRVARVIGGSCVHDPPHGLASPNGATPLADGGLLVTEIPGWIDRLDAHGRLLWSVRSPVTYPSDAQLLPNGRILVASFTSPGKIVELTRSGKVTWSFGADSGPNRLDQPSLAVRFPNGLIAANDDYNQRVIIIDPRTKHIVWQYGHTGVASSSPGYLSKPDGIDLLPAPEVAAPVRQQAAAHAAGRGPRLRVQQIGTLPHPVSRLAVVALPNGRVAALGGLLAGDVSSDAILAGPPTGVKQVGRLPVPTHDDAAAVLSSGIYLLGGGQAVSSDAVVRVRPDGHARQIGSLGEPLSDLGAAVVGRTAYLVGGYTGSRYATGILAFRGGAPRLVARLPVGLRYAGVAALGGRVYVAGGLTTAGPSNAVYSFDPGTHKVTLVARLPYAVEHSTLAPLGGALYLIGGDGRNTVLRITPGGRVSVAGRLPRALSGAAAIAMGTGIDIFGGDGSSAVYRLTLR